MNLPRLNWLDRLISPSRLKYREKVHLLRELRAIDGSEYGDRYLVREAKKARQSGKDQQSLEAAKIGKLTVPITIGEHMHRPFEAFRKLELQEIRHDGEKQQFHAYMNVLKCHIAHLEEIVARQGEELKRLKQ